MEQSFKEEFDDGFEWEAAAATVEASLVVPPIAERHHASHTFQAPIAEAPAGMRRCQHVWWCRLRSKIHAGHGTQEEDLVSCWMSTQAGQRNEDRNRLYRDTIDRCIFVKRQRRRIRPNNSGISIT